MFNNQPSCVSFRPVHRDKILSFPPQVLVLQHHLLLW
ncbi:hypothetical protein FQN60_015106 [Etheostoma spectabile]|uniref:Uncharacterized protein n=1 Tax=Etheostoma spectabile TaxID=54343 RepID=A0A5J5CP78_9PERO|nr:hypothetical protein FQN60_015106 [Etheostoma spectabile]